jgi:hypothetical protein
MPKAIDLTGQRFGNLKVIAKSERGAGVESFFICRCCCGRLVETRARTLKAGDAKSCGCQNKKHGLVHHPLYNVWRAMVHRCHNPKNPAYKRYGERGVFVCEEWRKSCSSFIEWAERNHWEKGLNIDRVDNDGGYSPENCQVITPAENSRKRGCNRLNRYSVMVLRDKHKHGATATMLSRESGIPRTTISAAINGVTWRD